MFKRKPPEEKISKEIKRRSRRWEDPSKRECNVDEVNMFVGLKSDIETRVGEK